MMFYEMLFGRTPWPSRSLKSLIKAISTQPLKFPYDIPISKLTKDFLVRCL